MKSTLSSHPHLAAFVALAVAMQAVLYATSRNVALQPTEYAAIALATVGLAALCVWILTWE